MPDYEVVLSDGSTLQVSASCDDEAAAYIEEEEEKIRQRNTLMAYMKAKGVKKDGKLI